MPLTALGALRWCHPAFALAGGSEQGGGTRDSSAPQAVTLSSSPSSSTSASAGFGSSQQQYRGGSGGGAGFPCRDDEFVQANWTLREEQSQTAECRSCYTCSRGEECLQRGGCMECQAGHIDHDTDPTTLCEPCPTGETAAADRLSCGEQSSWLALTTDICDALAAVLGVVAVIVALFFGQDAIESGLRRMLQGYHQRSTDEEDEPKLDRENGNNADEESCSFDLPPLIQYAAETEKCSLLNTAAAPSHSRHASQSSDDAFWTPRPPDPSPKSPTGIEEATRGVLPVSIDAVKYNGISTKSLVGAAGEVKAPPSARPHVSRMLCGRGTVGLRRRPPIGCLAPPDAADAGSSEAASSKTTLETTLTPKQLQQWRRRQQQQQEEEEEEKKEDEKEELHPLLLHRQLSRSSSDSRCTSTGSGGGFASPTVHILSPPHPLRHTRQAITSSRMHHEQPIASTNSTLFSINMTPAAKIATSSRSSSSRSVFTGSYEIFPLPTCLLLRVRVEIIGRARINI